MQVLRMASAMLIVMYIPGYVLSFVLFFGGIIDQLERAFISLIASISISTVICFVLLQTSQGLTASRFIVVAVCTTGVLMSILLFRLWRQRKKISPSIKGAIRWFLIKTSLIGILILITTISLGYALSDKAHNAVDVVEFYMQPNEVVDFLHAREVRAKNYRLPIYIVNHAKNPGTYRIEVWANGKDKVYESNLISVGVNEIDQEKLDISQIWELRSKFLDVHLFLKEYPDAIATLRVWLD